MSRRVAYCGAVLALVICGTWWSVRALSGSEIVPARYETVERGDIEIRVTETGTIEPVRKVEVKSKVAGRIARLLAQEGAYVEAGQLLAEIDPTEINSQVAQIEAQLEGVRARYEQAKRGVLYSEDQTRASIRQSEEAVRAAEARLRAAQEEDQAQPGLTASEIAQAEANLKAAQENRDLLSNSTHPQALVQARSTYEEAKASVERARRDLERQKRLLARGFVAGQSVDAAEAEFASANARLEQARKRLDLIGEQNRLELANAESRVAEARAVLARSRAGAALIAIKRQLVQTMRAELEQARAQLRAAQSGAVQDRMRQDDVAQAWANVRQLESQLREIQVRQRDTTLVAPMAGVVTRRYVEQGELVLSGVSAYSSGTPVLQIADLSQMLVRVAVNEVDVHKIGPGAPVEITVDGVKGEVFRGRVSKVSPAALSGAAPGAEGQQPSPTGGGANGGIVRYAVEVAVERSDPRLKPGMSARCAILIARKRGVLRLPGACVQIRDGQAAVQVVTETVRDGERVTLYTPRAVRIGLRGDTHVEIVSGLRPGERVEPGEFIGPKRATLDAEAGSRD